MGETLEKITAASPVLKIVGFDEGYFDEEEDNFSIMVVGSERHFCDEFQYAGKAFDLSAEILDLINVVLFSTSWD